MKIYKIAQDNYTEEMKKWYFERTENHIKLVSKYCNKIADKFSEYRYLRDRAKIHDDSKFEEPEMTPYIWITWKYKCKEDGKNFDDFNPPENIDALMHEATEHHVLNNRHHPEFHCGKTENVISESNRDGKPEKIIDATKMKYIDLAEMCADWMAVSEEKGNSPQSWAKKNIGTRWKFEEDQVDAIYEILDAVWDK